MASPDAYPTGPGSYNEFVEKHGLTHGAEAIQSHSDALLQYRLSLAAFHGITLEQLHSQQFDAAERPQAA